MPVSGIDLDLADVAARGIGEVGGIVERRLLHARLDHAVRQVMRHVGLEHHLADGLGAVGALDREAAVLELDVASAASSRCAAIFLPFSMIFSQALTIAWPPTAIERGAIGAHADRGLVGVAVDHLDVLDRHAELLGDQLGERGLVALAVGVGAGEHLHHAGVGEADLGALP